MTTRDTSDQSPDDGFLSRWSQRKQALRDGKPLAEPSPIVKLQDTADLKPNQPTALTNKAPLAPDLGAGAVQNGKEEQAPAQPQAQPPAPTMQDVHALTPQSDFKPFMRADVAPEVKNAAMKQLFKDPHFNVMDMMDVYVDDYSKPDPLPPEMLRKMAVTQFLGFWKEEEEEAEKLAAEAKAREDAQTGAVQNVAQSEPAITQEHLATQEQGAVENAATAQAKQHTLLEPHDHPDLQLQPDDAAGRQAPV